MVVVPLCAVFLVTTTQPVKTRPQCLVRLFGKGSDMVIDRVREREVRPFPVRSEVNWSVTAVGLPWCLPVAAGPCLWHSL